MAVTWLIRLSMDARRAGLTTFQRCGVLHSLDGGPFPAGAFTSAEWQQLRDEPMLEVIELSGPAPDPAAELRAKVRAAIVALSADEYTKAGVPQLGAIRAAIPEAGSEALKPVLVEVWAEMTADGFRRPGDVPPADPAPETTGATGPAPVPGDTDPAPVPGDTEPRRLLGQTQDDAGAPEEA